MNCWNILNDLPDFFFFFYRLLYGTYHPTTGIHFFKMGKIQNFQGLAESAKINLLQVSLQNILLFQVDHKNHQIRNIKI